MVLSLSNQKPIILKYLFGSTMNYILNNDICTECKFRQILNVSKSVFRLIPNENMSTNCTGTILYWGMYKIGFYRPDDINWIRKVRKNWK